MAEDLLGKVLVRKIGNRKVAIRINEVEVYDGFEDRASHASRGKTERNKIMFEEGGYFYIYLVYGMYWMINITTGKKNYPSAVLLRGGEIVSDLKPKSQKLKANLGGPGKLSKFLKVDKIFNEKQAKPKTGLWFEDWGFKVPKNKIKRTPRVGVHYAGPIWSKKNWRYVVEE